MNTTELRSFLGLCNVYRRFVSNLAQTAAYLNKKLRKGERTKFDLNEKEQAALDELKENLTNPPILALPTDDKPFVIETDAYDKQVGCVLLQPQENEKDLRPIGYWSSSLNDAKRRYETTQRKCLGVVWAVLMLRPYVEGSRLTVRTDHRALRWILDLRESTGRLARWRLRLMEFDFEIQYRPGRKNMVADELSRLAAEIMDETDMDNEIPEYYVEHVDVILHVCNVQNDDDNPTEPMIDDLLKEQSKDTHCQELLKKTDETDSPYLVDEKGVISGRSRLDGSIQHVIPTTLRQSLLYHAHNPVLAGNPGGRRM